MKTTNRQLRTRFGREVRFGVRTTPFRADQITELERLKDRLLREILNEATDPEENTLLRRAANDAAALAWVSQFPLLLFPALLEEMAGAALRQLERQRQVRKRSRNLLLKAA